MRSTMNPPCFFVGECEGDPRSAPVRVAVSEDRTDEHPVTVTLAGADVYLSIDAARELAARLADASSVAERRRAA
jgi:hypothetical protein